MHVQRRFPESDNMIVLYKKMQGFREMYEKIESRIGGRVYPGGFHRPSARCSSLIRSRFAFAAALFPSCVLERCCRRHLSTRILASLQPPEALCMKPCAWHSSRAAMTSWHAGRSLLANCIETDAIGDASGVPMAFCVCK